MYGDQFGEFVYMSVLVLPISWPLSLCKLQIIIKHSCLQRVFGICDF